MMNAKNDVGRAPSAAPDANGGQVGRLSGHSQPAADRSVSLRPGVSLPDWSLASDDSARAALAGIVELIGIGTAKWSPLGVAEDRVWRCVVGQFAALGRAPTLGEIADATGLLPGEVAEELKKLRARDVVVLDGEGRITGAYPFTERSSGHRVVVRGKTLSAMCAVDALGVGAMLGADAEIESSCRFCGAPIRAKTADAGAALAEVAPKGAVVWIGHYYADGCAASSTCTILAFFCSADHLAAWRAGEGSGHGGVQISVEAALHVGKAIFMPILRSGLGDVRNEAT